MWSMVPEVFCPLVRSHAHKMDQSMMPGLTHITWTSLNIHSFLGRVGNSIALFETFTKHVSLLLVAENPHYGRFFSQPPEVTNMFSLLYVTCRDY